MIFGANAVKAISLQQDHLVLEVENAQITSLWVRLRLFAGTKRAFGINAKLTRQGPRCHMGGSAMKLLHATVEGPAT